MMPMLPFRGSAPPLVAEQPTTPKMFDENGMLLPHYRTFSAIYNTLSRTYRYTWDEAIKHNRENARAMRRDAFIWGCLQERYLAVAQLPWAIVPEDKDDPVQAEAATHMEAVIKRTPGLLKMFGYLVEGDWFGRYGSQLVWSDTDKQGKPVKIKGKPATVVSKHLPINGDKIQFDFDGEPCIYLSPSMVEDYRKKNLDIRHADLAPMLALTRPDVRQRFIIHQAQPDDMDYYEGEMSGAAYGVGIRSRIYWAYYLRNELLSWAVDFMQKVGTLGLLVFFYEDGNPESKAAAETSAKEAQNRNAIAVPLPKGQDKKTAGMEMIPATNAGVETLTSMITDYCERHIERVIIGQSMSSKTEATGIGGDAQAGMKADTKFRIIKASAVNLAETLTTDLLYPAMEFNLPGVDFRLAFEFNIPDPDAKDKLEAAAKVISIGVSAKSEELRELAGLSMPGPEDETVGGQQGMGGIGGLPEPPPGGGMNPDGSDAPDGADHGDESDAAKIDALADIMGGLYGEAALNYDSTVHPLTVDWMDDWVAYETGASAWVEERGPKGGRRWRHKQTGKLTYTPPGEGQRTGVTEPENPEHLKQAHGLIREARANRTPEHAQKLMDHLQGMDSNDLQALREQYGLRCDPALKAKLVAQMTERLQMTTATEPKVSDRFAMMRDEQKRDHLKQQQGAVPDEELSFTDPKKTKELGAEERDRYDQIAATMEGQPINPLSKRQPGKEPVTPARKPKAAPVEKPGYMPAAAQETKATDAPIRKMQHQKTIAEIRDYFSDSDRHTMAAALAHHRTEVANAIRDGLKVPPEVLADYPDLQPAKQQAAPTPPHSPTLMPGDKPVQEWTHADEFDYKRLKGYANGSMGMTPEMREQFEALKARRPTDGNRPKVGFESQQSGYANIPAGKRGRLRRYAADLDWSYLIVQSDWHNLILDSETA